MISFIKNLLHRIVAPFFVGLFLLGSLGGLIWCVPVIHDPLYELFQQTPLAPILERVGFHDEHDHGTDTAAPILHQEQVMEIALSQMAAKNIGLDDTTIQQIKVVDYYKSLTIPGVVVERPGKSTMTVPSPVSGVITKIYCERGVSIKPGEPLFDILLNQQEMVKGQIEYLSNLNKREINASEMERLGGLDPQMVPKQRRELEFQKSEIELELKLQKNTLLMQGLTSKDITESLEKKGEIVRTTTIYAPPMIDEKPEDRSETVDDHTYTVEELYVTTGKNVEIGLAICLLSDLCELAIQGKAFAVNMQDIKRALNSRSRVRAVFDGAGGSREIIEGLSLRSIDNYIDKENGAIFCYVDLKNRADTHEAAETGTFRQAKRQYTNWYFKPGQRCELNIEYETLANCIVLPVNAVARDLNDACVFEWVGVEEDKRIWRKKPVHILYTTKDAIVIANDGALFPGAKISTKGASFILAALDAANQKGAGGGGGVQHGDHVH